MFAKISNSIKCHLCWKLESLGRRERCVSGVGLRDQVTWASIAQGLEHWSCKPGVESSNLSGGNFFYFRYYLFGVRSFKPLLNKKSKLLKILRDCKH